MTVGPEGDAVSEREIIRDAGEWAAAAHSWLTAVVNGSRTMGAQEMGAGVLLDRIAVPSAFLDAFVDQLGLLARNLGTLSDEAPAAESLPSDRPMPARAGSSGTACEIIPFVAR
ncbi:hypothetical protein ACUN0C_16585 [Faunimonas sp. B44]|uniref:hypothetical protein n=1 Tax=Faunimonas sp. B44 TaxID=3461493 RepID=UPI004044C36F